VAQGLGRARKGWCVRVARWTCWAGREMHAVSRKELSGRPNVGDLVGMPTRWVALTNGGRYINVRQSNGAYSSQLFLSSHQIKKRE
jgi:hypothetical protein